MKKGKRVLALLLALVLVIGVLPMSAFATTTSAVEGKDDALASVTYAKEKYTPDEHGIIVINVPYSTNSVSTKDITLNKAKGFSIGSHKFADATVKFPSKGGNVSTGLTVNYTKEGDKTKYERSYTVGFVKDDPKDSIFEGTLSYKMSTSDSAHTFKESEFTKLYKQNDGKAIKYISIEGESNCVEFKYDGKAYDGGLILVSNASKLKMTPLAAGEAWFPVYAYDSDQTLKDYDSVECDATIEVTVTSTLKKLTASVDGGGYYNLKDLGIPAEFKKVAGAELDSISFTTMPENGDIYNGSTKLTSRNSDLTAAELSKAKFKADELKGNKRVSDKIEYEAFDKSGNSYAGTIELTIKPKSLDLDDIEVKLKSNGKLAFSSLSMASKFKEDTKETLDCAYFTQPADGTLRYGYKSASQRGEELDEDELYYNTTSSKKLSISNITYVPDQNFTGTVYVYYTAYDTEEEEYEGRIVINVGESDMGEVGTYSIDSDEVLFFSEVAEDIDDMFTDVSSEKNFNYVTFVQPAVKEGSIRYGYESSTKQGSKISSSDKFYYSGSGKLVSDLVFVPDEDYEGEVELEFTVYGKGKDEEYDGTLTVKVSESDYELGTITFNVESGKVFKFDDVASAINTKFKKEADGNFKYLTFEEIPTKSKGTLYYDYDSKSNDGTKVEEDDDEFYRNDRTELQVKDLVLVPAKNFTGQIPLKYWAYGDGYSLGGKLIVTVKAKSAEFEALEYKIYNNQVLKLSSSDIAAKLKKVSDGVLDYITLAPAGSKTGNMYYSYISGSDNGGEFDGRDDLYRTGSKKKLIDDVTYVPLITYIGSFELEFTAYDDDDNSFDGKIKITVSEPDPFKDTKMNDWFYNAAKWGAGREIAKGTSTDPKNPQFSPNWDCTWAQILTFIWRANGSPKATINNPFTDLKSGDYCYDAILWAVANKIATPKAANEFGVNTPCTRGQALNFIYKAKNSPSVRGLTNNFNDVSANDDFYNAVLWGVDQGITNGTSATTFAPNTICTRGHIITFLYRAIERKDLQNGKTQ
ncbi:MAG: S-layer homology domain-containing protein [Firmicutes bacterium]|nr:S-layer homology domain-containing protein [Bacillota bacterium]